MNTGLALRLQGPMQAWGGPVVGDNRPTLHFPTRSGVLGLVAGCLGIKRHEHQRLFDLGAGTRVHVRVDRPGQLVVDDQTIQDNPNASSTRQTIQSKRSYLCDASFVAVVVPAASNSLEEICNAVAAPSFQPFLGRRTCVPALPLMIKQVSADEDPLGFFDTIPCGPEALVAANRPALDGGLNYYLDVDDHPQRLRRIRIRDSLSGPLPRQFRERWIVHVRRAGKTNTTHVDPWRPEHMI